MDRLISVPSPSSHMDDADVGDDGHLSMMTSSEIVHLRTCGWLIVEIVARHSTVSMETWQMNKHLSHNLQDMPPMANMHPNMLDDLHGDRENDVKKKVGYYAKKE